MDSRETRGRQLAQDPRIRQVDTALWFVPSEKSGGYLVRLDRDAGRCGCKDHQGQRTRCKHIVAAELVRDGQAQQVALTLPADPAKPRPAPRGDLTADEQARVRVALKFLRTRAGWAALAKGTRMTRKALENVAYGRPATGGLAIRLARFAGVPVDDVLCGRFPGDLCPHCGRGPEGTVD
mgnify:CR=1 FL=1